MLPGLVYFSCIVFFLYKLTQFMKTILLKKAFFVTKVTTYLVLFCCVPWLRPWLFCSRCPVFELLLPFIRFPAALDLCPLFHTATSPIPARRFQQPVCTLHYPTFKVIWSFPKLCKVLTSHVLVNLSGVHFSKQPDNRKFYWLTSLSISLPAVRQPVEMTE